MLTRHDLAELSRAHEEALVLSVYLAKESSDPGNRGAWRTRLEGALATVRADIEKNGAADLEAFDQAADLVSGSLEEFGRVLPYRGWSAFATAERLWHAEGLDFGPPDLVRWRQGIYAAPYVRRLKGGRPVIVVLSDRWRARLFRYEAGDLSQEQELEAQRSLADMTDVGMGKRASGATGATGVRGATRTDAAKRTLDEEVRRLRVQVADRVVEMAANDAGVVLGGTHRVATALGKELGERLPGRTVEVPELSFDSAPEQLLKHVDAAASQLTSMRQARLLEACADSRDRGAMGWNDTYRALAAGAVDTLLIARDLIESAPDDAERLVRLALAQGAEVEDLGGELGTGLHADADGVAARLRFRLLS